jgi:hypothetical protein
MPALSPRLIHKSRGLQVLVNLDHRGAVGADLNAFGAQRGWRCWSRTEPAVHYTFYEFADVEEARELTDSDKIKPLIADLDRVWGNRVSRRREILEIVQEIVS